MAASFFWYDFESTGVRPSLDRPLQVAGIRTNESLEEVGEPLNLYCRLPEDILPQPEACVVTGITPELLQARGIPEPEFLSILHQELMVPETCTAGYNTLRFDDELLRYALYRNFYDPYAREWQGGNSRWDLIDLVRTAYALRPEGIVWPEVDGRVSLRLELLSAANDLVHAQAHDALSDVRATIALARLIRARQPKLYDYLYQLRLKAKVQEQITLLKPLVHISGRFSSERHYLSVVLPLCWHPTNRNALIVCDLQQDPSPLCTESVETLHARLYSRREELEAAAQLPVPLKLVHINRCPVLAPMSVLRPQDIERLTLDLQQLMQRAAWLKAQSAQWLPSVQALYQLKGFEDSSDPEQALYSGFLSAEDRRLCDQIRTQSPKDLKAAWPFQDTRLPELLFRYRARHGASGLSEEERQRWSQFCRTRLLGTAVSEGALVQFERQIQALLAAAPAENSAGVLNQWLQYGQGLRGNWE